MTAALPWDAAAMRTLRGAESLIAAADVRWVARQPWGADPWTAFEQLIRAALQVGGAHAASGMLPRSAAAVPGHPQSDATAAPMRPSTAPAPGRAARLTALRRGAVPARLVAVVDAAAGQGLKPVAAASVLPVPSLPAVQYLWPADGAATTAARALRLLDAPVSRTDGAAPGLQEPLVARASLRPVNAAAQTTAAALRAAAAVDEVHGAAPQAIRGEGLPRAADPPLPLPPVTLDPQRPHAASATLAPSRPRAPSMRLVEGVPALQGLLQAAVAQSQAQHAAPAAIEPAALPAAPMQPAPALRALPQLDAVAEDMLVDRLTDRLQERLREQALRQFGFTGGLT